jgi:hypothetical protein
VQGYPTVLRDFSGGAGVPLDQEMEYLQRSLAHVILEAKCNVVSPLSFFVSTVFRFLLIKKCTTASKEIIF